MHSLSLILAAAAIGLGLAVADRTVNEPAPATSHHRPVSLLPG
ncbi:hypothetical protein OQ252_03525 [Acetobacter farinalis]|uniref:Uncharacterized protein n=1 Tax=Acetobacter farinalis TaxID=1260984 RepID=A0ABT3Q5B2_9PROT|nr:hypothetical protein [Acetobacter farinalis]MCX2560478.1 hypothetical protein [Acetobacter farinalis]